MSDIYSTRKLDELGRLVLPMEFRRVLSLAAGDCVDISLANDGETVTLRKSSPSCLCCQGAEALKALPNGTYLCRSCLNEIK